jgi:CBS domain-containing protein
MVQPARMARRGEAKHVGSAGLPQSAERVPVMRVMPSTVLCVTRDVDLDALNSALWDGHVNGATVVDSMGRPAGVICRSDVARFVQERAETSAAELQQRTPEHGQSLAWGMHVEPVPRATVDEVMTPFAFTIAETATIGHAAELMAYECIHRLPVVSRNRQVVGVLRALDILRWLSSRRGTATRSKLWPARLRTRPPRGARRCAPDDR